MRDERKIQKELRVSEALEPIRRYNSLMFLFDIYQRNFRDLDALLSNHNSSDNVLKTRGTRGRRLLTEMQIELLRHLQNTLGSAISLRNHAIRLRKLIEKDGDDISWYVTEFKARFDSNRVARFVHDLRNYLVHDGMPKASTVTGPRLETTLKLDQSSLLEYKQWNEKSLEYINAHPDGIDLHVCMMEYDKNVVEFYQWFEGDYKAFYAAAFAKQQALVDELKTILLSYEAQSIMSFLGRLPERYSMDDVFRQFTNVFSEQVEADLRRLMNEDLNFPKFFVAFLSQNGFRGREFLKTVYHTVLKATDIPKVR